MDFHCELVPPIRVAMFDGLDPEVGGKGGRSH